MRRILKTAAIQVQAESTAAETVKKAVDLIELSVKEGAKIVCLPQLFNLRWFAGQIDKSHLDKAEPQDGPTIKVLKKCAKKNSVYIVAPIFEVDNGTHYSTAFLIDDSGEVVGKYRKIHIPQIPLWEEREYFSKGDLGFPVFDTPIGKIGVLICWDIFFPEAFRSLALKGCEVVFCPTSSAFFHSRHKWERAIQASAHANGMFAVRVNRIGKETQHDFYGRSFITRPDGDFLLKPSGSQRGIAVAELDLAEVSVTRNEWVFLKDRLPKEYGEICK